MSEDVEWPAPHCQLCNKEIDGGVSYRDGKGMCKECYESTTLKESTDE